jgi:aspartate aminotransferase
MPQQVRSTLEFGAPALVDASLSENARGLIGSEILKIAGDIRRMVAAGHSVCNLTVGDFNSKHFPIPERLLESLQRALADGETNYPPSNGIAALRKAVCDFTARNWGVHYPVESVLIAGGARPILYGAFRTVLNPGDRVVYPVPSWNNNHYCWMAGVEGIPLTTRAEDGFMPTLDQLAPHLGAARMICINSPLNPTGTVIDEAQLRSILQALVAENDRRTRQGRPHLFLLHDQIYSMLVFGSARHVMPLALVPESAPWVISLDGISKCFAATGLRVGWVLAAPELTERMKNILGHVGAWAPRPEQVAVAEFLADAPAVETFQKGMNQRVQQRLEALYNGFMGLKQDGYRVDCISPQGAIYLSLRLDLIGRSFDGMPLETNEDIRKLLLEHARLAVIPFQAFGLEQNTGWFRLSVGTVSLEEIEEALPRVRGVLDRID